MQGRAVGALSSKTFGQSQRSSLGQKNDGLLVSNFVSKNRPENRNLLRLLLVSELVKAPSSSYPAGVSVDFLLDETVNFFLPPDDHREESRVLSLKPLQAYVSGKMRTMAGIFGINEEYSHSQVCRYDGFRFCDGLLQIKAFFLLIQTGMFTFELDVFSESIKKPCEHFFFSVNVKYQRHVTLN